MNSHCKWGHPRNEENTYVWRGMRHCRVCRRVRNKLRQRASAESFSDHLQTLSKRGLLYRPQKGPLGHIRAGLEATETPTICDIAWAAGIFEGEGTCSDLQSASVTQKNTWILHRLEALFGGRIQLNYSNGCSRWRVTGSRARGFLMTVYLFLSPNRKLQVLSFLGRTRANAWRDLREKHPAELSRPH